MTDEEMAEEYKEQRRFVSIDDDADVVMTQNKLLEYIKQAHLAGLKAGRPKWHDLRKDPNDLPEAENHFWSRDVLFQTNKGSSIIGFYDHASKAWYEKTTDDILLGVIAWCEIPQYTEE